MTSKVAAGARVISKTRRPGMVPQKSDTLEQLEQVLHSYAPDQRTTTNMVISGPEDVVQGELTLLARSAHVFCVDVATVYSDVEEEALVIFDGNARDVAQLVAYLNDQTRAASAC
jgi:hypothetical protein